MSKPITLTAVLLLAINTGGCELLDLLNQGSSTGTGHTREEIESAWEQYKPSYTGSAYVTAPSLTSPYSTGTLAEGFLEDGMKMAGFVRFLTEVPEDLVRDSALEDKAQHGAVLLYASEFSHYPAKPADMSQSFYDVGYDSTSSSNIAWGYSTLHSAVRGYMSDGDTGNMAAVGHRRWIVNPPLYKPAFGYAEARSTMQVFDSSRPAGFEYETIMWPNQGDFPVSFFYSSDPWSVTFNTDVYDYPDLNTVEVVVINETTGDEWTLNADDNTTSTDQEYFNAQSDFIVFRPAVTPGSLYMNPGETYSVKISGLKKTDGSAATLDYTVNFFELQE